MKRSLVGKAFLVATSTREADDTRDEVMVRKAEARRIGGGSRTYRGIISRPSIYWCLFWQEEAVVRAV